MLLLATLAIATTMHGPGAQLPASLLEQPLPTAPSASCAPGVPANQCLVAPSADADGELDDNAAGAQLLLSLDELVFFVRDVASFSPDSDACKRYLPVVHAVLEEIQDLVAVMTMEKMQDEVMPPSISSQMIFKHWCRSELPKHSAKLLCPRYIDRLARSDGVWQTVHEQLQPAVGFLTRLVDVWTIRFKRQRTQAAGGGDTRPPLRVVVSGAGPAGLINAATAYTAGADVTVLEKRGSYERSVWFDLTSSQHILKAWDIYSPAQDIMNAFGWGEQETHQKASGNAGIVHVRCAELERFFSKVLSFLSVTVLTNRKGLGLCPVPLVTVAQNATATNPEQQEEREWAWVAARTGGSTVNDYSGLQPKALCARVAAGAAGDAESLQQDPGWALPAGWVEDVLCEGDMAGTTFFYEQANPGNILWEPPPGSTKRQGPEGGVANEPATSGWRPPAGLEVHGVDLLIGADGSKSVVRCVAGVEFEPQDALMLPEHRSASNNAAAGQRRSLRLDGLEQTTLIAKFAQIEGKNGRLRCPPTRAIDERTNGVVGLGMIDPFYPALVITGVTSVFKRFFEEECEIQVGTDLKLYV